MLEIIDKITDISYLACAVYFLYWLTYTSNKINYKSINIPELKSTKQQSELSNDIHQRSNTNVKSVEQLPPEVLAPAILAPPKMRGGFGKVEK